ncbi:polyhomeotic-like protein 2 isoform X1 [Marmota marmota marmota]|uniref:polyhomeotic-like protein 2 isoform X1 n=1 Tax=Marmota marmota marmota TaxID=9994 RepID=UPI002092C0DF|nr:polyhomeotic-like protein 2 isoform X1 [Marmota marmota marmota]XP_048671758.1 polyhomeotic-like protein 2 isoform X1 [Marmota marmota marmota]
MENELPVPHTSSSASVTNSTSGASSSSGCNNSSSGGSGRPPGPQISVYSGIPDRQTVQVIQQALHRQPSTAAQYLQQMYAAQQQHLMLQTAALQQQHLSSAQLQSLAAVQQASLMASRQGSTSGSSASAQAPAQSPSINLATSPAAAQLINRAQSVNSATASGLAQQAVLLGNTSSPALTASQAQMYLRAQMAQPGNLVQVARSLGGTVPLSPQLIFTPTATVATVQPELGTGSPARPPTPAQVQNLTLRTQQTPAAAASGPNPTQPVLPSLALKPTPGSSQPLPTPSQGRNTAQGSPAGAKPGVTDSVVEPLKKGDGNGSLPGSVEGRAGLSRTVPAVAAHPLIAPETGQGIVHALTDLSSPGMTSGNGNSASSIAGTAPQNGENKPPQAIVKPQILTHVIEGFVIQEGAEPFPVGRSSLLVGNLKKKYAQGFLPEKLPQQDHTTTTDSEMEEPYLQESKEEGTPLKLKCELCGRVDFAYKFKRSKRFCSMACAKRYNVGCTKRVGLFHSDRSKLQKTGSTTHNRRRASKASLPTLTKDTKKQPTGTVPLSVTAALQLTHSQEDSSRCSDNSSYEEPLSPISASSSTSRRRQGQRDLELPDMHMRDLVGMGHHFLPSEPTKWNVEDVYEFIRSLPGCQEIAEEFRAQEIDGQALLLLKEDHLMSAMNIKLGPALKIYARISMLKDS